MSRTPARVNQPEIARAIRAMASAGFDKVRVVIHPSGEVVVEPTRIQEQMNKLDRQTHAPDQGREIVM